MEDVSANDSVETCRFSITPLIGFAADWPALRYDFSRGVSVVHNNEDAARLLGERLCQSPRGLDEEMKTNQPELAWVFDKQGAEAIREADWLLIMPSFQQAAHVPKTYYRDDDLIWKDDYGDYADRLRKVYRKSFVTTLRLFGSGVATPFHFLADAELMAEGIQDVKPFRCQWDWDCLDMDMVGGTCAYVTAQGTMRSGKSNKRS